MNSLMLNTNFNANSNSAHSSPKSHDWLKATTSGSELVSCPSDGLDLEVRFSNLNQKYQNYGKKKVP